VRQYLIRKDAQRAHDVLLSQRAKVHRLSDLRDADVSQDVDASLARKRA
jgi:hypothetical protein